ncbi:MAG TPA: cytochrome c [Candidatus Eisenbacteria bacterium]|jgi:mono/diheme cytochrome c family protein
MRRITLIGTLLTATSVGLCLLAISCSTNKPSATAVARPDPVVRGRYLVTIMSCNDCHTPGYFYGAPDTLRRLAGSDLGWVGPWGVVHARNLTPDSATGIGSWTIEQIVTALRSGNTPSGVQLAPIMPWENYSSILDQDDAMAIASYLKSLPPVTHKNLDRIPPTAKPSGATIAFPPPPAWDVPPIKAPGGGQ